MPNVSGQDSFFKLGDIVDSYIRVNTGQLAISVPLKFQGKNYPLYCAILEPGDIQGFEFVFQSNHSSVYDLIALKNTDLSVVNTHAKELYKKEVSEIMDLFLEYQTVINKLITTQSAVDKIFSVTHRIFYSFIAVLSYVVKKYSFSVQSADILELIETLNQYIQQHHLDSKLFPLTDALYKIPFSELDPYALDENFIHSFYLQRILQIMPYIQKGIGKDKIFTLNLLMDSAFKTEKLTQSMGQKMQYAVQLLEKFTSDSMLRLVKEFLQQAERSQEISSYIFLVVKSTVSFFEKNVIQPLEKINYELFLLLKDAIEPYKDLISKTEYATGTNHQKEEPVPQELQGSMDQIFDYAEIDPEFRVKFLEEFNRWKISPNRMAVDDEIAKIRKRIAEYFWKLYTLAFKQHKIANKPLIKPIELFFKYGFIDESLVGNSILRALLDHSTEKFKENDLHVYNTYDWLIAVCDQVVSPSNSKTGEYLDVTLRELARDEEQKTGQKIDPKEFNTLEFRIEYEIDNFIRESAKVCNGNFSTYIPVLLEEQFPILDLNQQFLSSDKITRTFMELKKIDFSAFYREVRYKDGNIEEFVQKEVLPVFVLMPGVGNRSIVWQPKERLKDTFGRIALPFLSFTKPMQNMIHSFGFYRWEIVKDILGPSWNDISLLSLTSEYSDYESSYKNSKDLDEEMREKVAQDFKKYRNTRDRFIHDYGRWITIDSQGRPGVNKVVRELFYRQIPFPKEVRAKLGSTPAYEPLNDRYIILMKKEIARLKLRFQKYQKEDGHLPTDLEAYLQFLTK